LSRDYQGLEGADGCSAVKDWLRHRLFSPVPYSWISGCLTWTVGLRKNCFSQDFSANPAGGILIKRKARAALMKDATAFDRLLLEEILQVLD
jgi:hypothetical protein